MPRTRIDGYPIGCPAAHGEGNCPLCGGGWPGTKSPSEKIISAIKNGDLLPMNLGCGTLEAQAEFLQDYFIRMFLIGRGVMQMAPKTSCVEIFQGKNLEDHYQILANPEFVPALLVGEEEELGVGPVNAILPTNEWFAIEKKAGVLAPDFSD